MNSTPFHAQKSPNLGDKLYGHCMRCWQGPIHTLSLLPSHCTPSNFWFPKPAFLSFGAFSLPLDLPTNQACKGIDATWEHLSSNDWQQVNQYSNSLTPWVGLLRCMSYPGPLVLGRIKLLLSTVETGLIIHLLLAASPPCPSSALP